MKKLVFLAVSLLALTVMVSCSSSNFSSQDQANAAFEKVYAKYASNLILDGAQTYEVRSGDTLSRIANEYYGSGKGYYFPVIMLASRDVVLDPDLIAPGMQLTIPDLDANLENPQARSNLKNFFTDVSDVYRRKDNATVHQALIDIANEL